MFSSINEGEFGSQLELNKCEYELDSMEFGKYLVI
jgi:hypothetical protein